VGELVAAVDALAGHLLAGLKTVSLVAQILAARRRTLQFFDGLYMDLYHLAGNLVTATGKGRIAEGCHDVQRLIDQARSPIIAQGHPPLCGLTLCQGRRHRHIQLIMKSASCITGNTFVLGRGNYRPLSAPSKRSSLGNHGEN
jgi:hypothetical protein